MERKARGNNFNFKQQCICEWSEKANYFLGRPIWEINITGNTTFGLLCDTHLNSKLISGTIDDINSNIIVNTVTGCAKSSIPSTKKTKCNKKYCAILE